MLASLTRALCLAAACAALGAMPVRAADPATTKPAITKPAAAKPASGKPAEKSPPSGPKGERDAPPRAGAARNPAPAPAPPPPPPVELIGYVVMPPGTFRGGPPSGQFDADGRR